MYIRNNWKHFHRILQIPEAILWFSRHLDLVSRENRPNFGKKQPACLDDILVVTKGQHKRELIEVLTILVNAGYRLSEIKRIFSKPKKRG